MNLSINPVKILEPKNPWNPKRRMTSFAPLHSHIDSDLHVYDACLAVVVVILVTRIAKDALQRAVEEADVKVDEIIVASDPLIAADPFMELQQPLVVRIDNKDKNTPDNSPEHQPSV